jgi:hypothetical protein
VADQTSKANRYGGEIAMRKMFYTIILIAGFTMLAGGVYGGATMKSTEAADEPPPDPKKKKVGEECKRSEECPRHHGCRKSGEKKVCTAPPHPELPPGVVT